MDAHTDGQAASATARGRARAWTQPRRSSPTASGWLFAASAAVLAVYALDMLFGVLPADLSELFKRFALPAVFFGAAGQCALRARAAQSEASAWWLFSLALMAWGGGSLYYGAVLWNARTVPIPSPADWLWIVFYAFAYGALFALLRSWVRIMRRNFRLDAAISALGITGVLAAVTLPSVLGQHGQTTVGFLTIAAYPLGDLGLLALVIAAMSVIGLKRSGPWRLIALAFSAFVIADSMYLVQVAHGTYRSGGVVDLGWPLAAILLGGAASRSGESRRPELSGKPTITLPAASSLLALGLLVYGQFWPLHVAALGLAIATIIAALLRLFLALRSNTLLLGVLTEEADERRRVAEVLTRSEEGLRQAERMVGGGSCEISLDDTTMTWSDGFLRIHGRQPGSRLDRESYLAGIHPRDRQHVLDAVAECLESGRATTEYRITRPNGAERTLRAEGEIVERVGGPGRYLRCGVLDITDERAGFDTAPIGMSVAGPEHLELRRVNGALCSMLGRERDELMGMRIDDLRHPDDQDSIADACSWSGDSPATGYHAETRFLRPDGGVVWAEVHVTPVCDFEGSLQAFSTQAIDITDRKISLAEVESARVESLRRLSITSEYRDNETHEHTERVGRLAEEIGGAAGVPGPQLSLLRLAAPLHDIGKIGIADGILLKPGRLTADERETMQGHTLIGADILSGSRSETLQMAEQIAAAHHEKWDGTGYPHGLQGNDIPLVGRIVAIADVFDALTHARPYKEAWSVGRAVAHICSESGSHFDPRLVAAFADLDHAALASCERQNEAEAQVDDHDSPARPARARAISEPETDGGDRDHAAAHRDEVASERDHAASERDHIAAEVDEGISLRDKAASGRDRARNARDHNAGKRDQSEARADGQIETRDDAACARDYAATTRDRTATERDLTESCADPVAASASRTSSRDQAVQDRGLAAADRIHAAFDRDQTHKEADHRNFNRYDAAEDRKKAVADRAITADDRERSEEEADLRRVDRDDSATDRVLASADREKAAADRVASMGELDQLQLELRRAQIDEPTGALGRQAGIAELSSAVDRAQRDSGTLIIAHVRVPGLQQANDCDGHPAGDALLREVVGALQVHLNRDDPIVRLSGDHFLCALQGSDARDAQRRFADVRKQIELYHHGASIDVRSAVMRSGETLRQLAHRADAAVGAEVSVGA